MKGDPALAGEVAAVALWVLEELDLGFGMWEASLVL